LPVRSCVIDGEAIVCDDNGLAVFDLIRGHATNASAILCAFDLLEVNGEEGPQAPAIWAAAASTRRYRSQRGVLRRGRRHL
jgi:ATP-dependent DNA ligase